MDAQSKEKLEGALAPLEGDWEVVVRVVVGRRLISIVRMTNFSGMEFWRVFGSLFHNDGSPYAYYILATGDAKKAIETLGEIYETEENLRLIE